MIDCSINLEQDFTEFIDIYWKNRQGQRLYNRINFNKRDDGNKIRVSLHTGEEVTANY